MVVTEKKLLDNFIEYLLNHGYPTESIALEYKLDNLRRVDLAVIDSITNVPLMLFEFKQYKTDSAFKQGGCTLKNFKMSLKNIDVPMYLVIFSDEEPFFELFEVNSYTGAIIGKIESFKSLDFEYQRIARLSEKAKKAEKDKRTAIDTFSVVSWVLAAIFILLIIVNKFTEIELSATDLTLIGAAVGLILIPFSSKIKFFGIEFERYTKAKEE